MHTHNKSMFRRARNDFNRLLRSAKQTYLAELSSVGLRHPRDQNIFRTLIINVSQSS